MSRVALTVIALTGSAVWAQTAPTPPVAAPAPAAVPAPVPAAMPAPAPMQPTVPAPQPPLAQPPNAAQAPAPAVAPPVAPPVVPPPAPFVPAPPAAARTPSPPAPPTPPVKGLPPDAPKLVVNGGIYSPRRDLRMAIVNGNVVREGANVDGVVVEQIQPDGVVLAYRGARYHVMY